MPTIKSSTIKSCDRDAETGETKVCFHKGASYVYTGIDAALYNEWMDAESHGSFFHHKIKGKFAHHKIEDE